MEGRFCTEICMACRRQCVVKVDDGCISFYGCYARRQCMDVLRLFAGDSMLKRLYVLSNDGRFVGAAKQLGRTASDGTQDFEMQDGDFYRMIRGSVSNGACEWLAELDLAEWSRENGRDQGGADQEHRERQAP